MHMHCRTQNYLLPEGANGNRKMLLSPSYGIVAKIEQQILKVACELLNCCRICLDYVQPCPSCKCHEIPRQDSALEL